MTSMADRLTKARAQGIGTQKPLPVEVVRPNSSPREQVLQLVTRVGFIFLDAWLVMLLLPTFTHWHLGYWQALAALFVVRTVLPGHSYAWWTRASRKSERSK